MKDQEKSKEELLAEIAALRREVEEYRELKREHLQALREFERSEELTRLIFECVPGGIVQVQRDGRVVRANVEAQRLLGLSFDALTQRYITEFRNRTLWEDGNPCPPEEYPIMKTIMTGKPQPPATIGVVRPDGGITWATFASVPVYDSTGELWGGVVTFLDVTERKQMEEALRRARDELERRVEERTAELSRTVAELNAEIAERRELEEQLRQAQKMEEIGKLAGGIAHDFNNLLMAIRGYAEVMLASMSPDDPQRARAEPILQNAERAGVLVQRLLAFSRKQVLQPTPLDLNAVISGMEQLLRRCIGEDIELTVKLPSTPSMIFADRGQIEQVLLNLAINARDAMPQGGKLHIQVTPFLLDTASARRYAPLLPGEHIQLSIHDTGHGIAPELQARIFEPFFTTKDVGKGSGLGLSMVYGIIKQSGGHISVQSEPGKGATFVIVLPRTEESAPVEQAPEPLLPRNGSGTETILVVEDEADVRALLCELLQIEGYRTLEASDGVEAIRIAQEYSGPIHLMLSDVVMPKMSGGELAEQLRQIRPETRLLYTSGYTDDKIAQGGILESGVAFLQKPFSLTTLTQVIREILDQEG